MERSGTNRQPKLTWVDLAIPPKEGTAQSPAMRVVGRQTLYQYPPHRLLSENFRLPLPGNANFPRIAHPSGTSRDIRQTRFLLLHEKPYFPRCHVMLCRNAQRHGVYMQFDKQIRTKISLTLIVIVVLLFIVFFFMHYLSLNGSNGNSQIHLLLQISIAASFYVSLRQGRGTSHLTCLAHCGWTLSASRKTKIISIIRNGPSPEFYLWQSRSISRWISLRQINTLTIMLMRWPAGPDRKLAIGRSRRLRNASGVSSPPQILGGGIPTTYLCPLSQFSLLPVFLSLGRVQRAEIKFVCCTFSRCFLTHSPPAVFCSRAPEPSLLFLVVCV